MCLCVFVCVKDYLNLSLIETERLGFKYFAHAVFKMDWVSCKKAPVID